MAFLVGVAVARFLGPIKFGQLSFALSYTSIFAIFCSLGLEHIAVREFVKHPALHNEILGSIWCLKTAATVMILVVIGITTATINIPQSTRLLVFILSINLFFYTLTGIDYYFQSRVQGKITAKMRMTALLIVSLARLFCIWQKAPVVVFAALFVLEGAILSASMLYQFNQRVGTIWHWNSRRVVERSLLKNSWPLIVSGLAVSVFLKIDQVMLQLMIGEKAVGEYAAASKISEALYFVAIAMTTTFFPAIIDARKYSIDLFRKRLQQFYDLMVWTGILFTIAVSVLAKPMVVLLFGGNFSNAGPVLLIHSLALVFVFMAQAGSRWFLSEQRQLPFAFIQITACAVNILLNWILIPLYGILGAAFATVISYWVTGHVGNLIFPADRHNFCMLLRSFNPIGAWKRTAGPGIQAFKKSI
ncbi:flippase [bacterium]|nr:flippase [bacterium]